MTGEPRLSEHERQLLELVYEFFRSNQQWPTYRWLNQIAFVQYGLEFDQLYANLPSGLLLPDPHRRITAILPPDNPIALTLRGVSVVAQPDDIDTFVFVVRELGSKAASFLPPPGETGELTVTSTEMATALGRDTDSPSLILARELIVNSLWEMWAGSSRGEGGQWTISLSPEKARRYRDVNSLDDVLELHAPLETERQDWARAVAEPSPLSPDDEFVPLTDPETLEVHGDKVFVVYGRNEAARTAMFDFLTALGLEPLSWDKLLAATGEASPYVGQVLETGFHVAQAVVVLLTPDDEARLRPHLLGARDAVYERELTPQARPNVLFEAGMALVSHQKRTVLVELGQLRPFSDVAGRHTVRMNDSIEQRRALASRLQTAGCPVSLDGDWREAGGRLREGARRAYARPRPNRERSARFCAFRTPRRSHGRRFRRWSRDVARREPRAVGCI